MLFEAPAPTHSVPASVVAQSCLHSRSPEPGSSEHLQGTSRSSRSLSSSLHMHAAEKPFWQSKPSMACTSWTRGEYPRRVAAREMRDSWDEGGFEVRSSRFSELRTSDRAFLAYLPLHALRLRDAGGIFQHPAHAGHRTDHAPPHS